MGAPRAFASVGPAASRCCPEEADVVTDPPQPAPAPAPAPASPAGPPVLDPVTVIRSKAYLSALVLAALLGIPISAVAYGFLVLVTKMQDWLFTGLPTALTIRYLPGNAGHSPALGFVMGGGPPRDRDLTGVILAAFATLSLGAVLGPEAPLIAIGGGLGALAVRQVKKDVAPMAVTIMASAGSFAAVSTLFGSPLLAAFLIMEAAGIAGTTLTLVALPGLLASGIGALVFVGLDNWTGLGTFSLALTTVPPGVDPTVASLLWAVPVGLLGALLGWAVRWVGLSVRPLVHRRRVPVTVGLGALVGITAMAYQLITGNGFTEVLFSGQDALPNLVASAADYSVATLVVLGLCKMLAYGLSLSAFRGGPVFPAMFIGAVLGIGMSGLPGMSLAPAIGMGIGAMCCAMLRLPLTSVLLATVLLGADGITETPLVVISVAGAFVVTMLLPSAGPNRSEPEPTRPLG